MQKAEGFFPLFNGTCTQPHMLTPKAPSEEYMMLNCEANDMTLFIAWEKFIRRITALPSSQQQPNICTLTL